eukprot:CAMPEP_0185208410 /NCGR_PEP_ID=MMETSP1140-20130426/61989_1 /TAXON_ID=298111 /ORGANISM="Pavlova sp., Strain CCMP459" /LENGTH=223 /DNA_ID=CAMNT_0027776127 /DNA_START=63 /DNA_END=734 /DNA_ORIENTATION=-
MSSEGPRALFLGIWPRLLTYGAVKMSLFGFYEHFRRDTWGLSPAAAGALAGLSNSVMSCPADVVKSRCQVAMLQAGAGSAPVQFMRTLRDLVTVHGARSLFTGLLPLAARDTLGYAILFSVFDVGQQQNVVPSWMVSGLAGCSFYAATLPVDRVKAVMMTQSFSRPAYGSWFVAARSIVAEEGLQGLYRGVVPTLARTFVGQAVGLTVYASMMAATSADNKGE